MQIQTDNLFLSVNTMNNIDKNMIATNFIAECNKMENNRVNQLTRIASEQDCYEAMNNADYWETYCLEKNDVATLDLLRKTVWEAIEAYDKKHFNLCLNRLVNSGAIIQKMMEIVSNEQNQKQIDA